MIKVESIEVNVANKGHITNCYIVYDDTSKEAIVIDPGYDFESIKLSIEFLKVNVKYICITHAHGDHIGALEKLQNYTKAKIAISSEDYCILSDMDKNCSNIVNVELQHIDEDNIIIVKDKDILEVGDLKFEIISTPGHTKGSICIYVINSSILFTGDTMFSDCYGRCDLYSGNFEDMVGSIKKLFDRFKNVQIYPGHGEICSIENSKKYIRMLMGIKNIQI